MLRPSCQPPRQAGPADICTRPAIHHTHARTHLKAAPWLEDRGLLGWRIADTWHVRGLTAGRKEGVGVDAAFDAIGGAHFARSFACLAPGGLLVGYGAQTMAVGGAGLASAALGLARLKLWDVLSGLFGGRHAVFYSITTRRTAHPEDFSRMLPIFCFRSGKPPPLSRRGMSAKGQFVLKSPLGPG